MDRLNLKELAGKKDGVFVSIYLPTHRNAPENKQDRIRFKNLLGEVSSQLKEKFPKVNTGELLKEAENLHADENFWNYTRDGLAFLVNGEGAKIIQLEGNVPERVVVGERFHLLPLLNYYEFMNATYILDVSKDRFKLYYGNHEGIKEVETPDVHQRFSELYDDKDIQSAMQSAGGGILHGQKSKSEIDKIETEKYLRYVAKGIGNFIKQKPAPIVVFGTTEVVSAFKELAKNEMNITKVIDKPLVALNTQEIYAELKSILLPRFEKEMEELIENLNLEISQDRGTDNASRILEDAKTGRVRMLFTGTDRGDLAQEDFDALIQDVLTTDGEVVVIDEERTDFPIGLGAIYRY